jgi:hypothetical protein
MSTWPRRKSKGPPAREMFYVENGRRRDRALHEEILAGGDDAIIRAISKRARERRMAERKAREQKD